MTTDKKIFSPKSLPLKEWPSEHSSAWNGAFLDKSLFNNAARATQWRDDSIRKTLKGYGVWLNFLKSIGVTIEGTAPEFLVTQSHVHRYIEALLATNTGYTPYNRICELCDAIRVMAPFHDWGWLFNARSHLRSKAKASRKKNIEGLSASKLEKLGVSLMHQAERLLDDHTYQAKPGREWRRAETYRDGLMIAILARRSLRNKNISQLSIGADIIIHKASATIFIEARDAKAHKIIELPFPIALFNYLLTYISTYRPVLLSRRKIGSSDTLNALWINRSGTPLSEQSFRKIIRNRTEADFGRGITPHWFRDIGATTLISADPGAANLAANLLSHNGPEQLEKHYNHTSPNLGAGRYAQALAKMRRGTRKHHGNK